MTTVDYLVGLDVGQVHDFTAIAVIERQRHATQLPEHRLRHLERLPLGTPYPLQVQRVSALVRSVEERAFQRYPAAQVRLIIDQTGVGRAVFDMLRRAVGVRIIAVTITGGTDVTGAAPEFRAPKRELVGTLQVLLQTGRLQVAAGMPLVDVLTTELQAFRVTVSDRGHDTYSNDPAASPNDDLVLALGLATWIGERPGPLTEAQRRAIAPW